MYMRNRDVILDAIKKRLRTDLQVPTALNKELVVILEKLKAAEVAEAAAPRPKRKNSDPDGA